MAMVVKSVFETNQNDKEIENEKRKGKRTIKKMHSRTVEQKFETQHTIAKKNNKNTHTTESV